MTIDHNPAHSFLVFPSMHDRIETLRVTTEQLFEKISVIDRPTGWLIDDYLVASIGPQSLSILKQDIDTAIFGCMTLIAALRKAAV